MKIRVALVLAVCLTATAWGDDWPQWRGPNRDGVSKETGLLKTWPAGGPKLAWTFNELGVGYSGPAVVGDRIYLAGTREDEEYLFALDTTGKKVWEAKLGPTYNFQNNSFSAGPHATPTVDGDLIFVTSSAGNVVCVDTKGTVKWSKSMPNDLGGVLDGEAGGGPPKTGWGYGWTPLVDGDNLICVPGGPKGLLAALNKKTGAVVWQSKDAPDLGTYSSPVLATVGGIKHYVAMVPTGVVGIATDGKLLWRRTMEQKYADVICPAPIVHDDHVFTTAWGGPNELIKLSAAGGKVKAEAVYSNKDLWNIQGGVVLVGDYVYGFHDKARWVCLEFKTGTVKWDARTFPAGSLIAADGMLYLLASDKQKGGLALVEANPAKFTVKSKADLPEPSTLRRPGSRMWTHPVIANGKLYLRDQEFLYCYEVK